MSLTTDALDLAAQGFPVFPCLATKRPACLHGFHDASLDPDFIPGLFSHHAAALIGVPTGEITNRDVLDIDPDSGGMDWEHILDLPNTMTVRTPRGGFHYYFIHAPGVRISAGKVAPGIDIRGDGGYVCVPPSTGYEVIDDREPVHWPDWLLELVLNRKDDPESPPRPNGVNGHDPAVPVSSARLEAYIQSLERHVSASLDSQKYFRVRNAGLMIGGLITAYPGCITLEGALQRLLNALPAERVKSWDNARKGILWGLTEGQKRPKFLEDRPYQGNGSTPPSGILSGQFRGRQDGAEEAPPITAGNRQEPPETRKAILTLADLDALQPPEWLVHGLIPEGSLVVPYGPPKAGKSFILLSLGLHIAAGKDWFGMKVKAGAVVYIAGEGVGGLKKRVKAMRQAYEIDLDIPFWIIPRAINFRDPKEVKELALLVRDTLKMSRFAETVTPVLIIIDTLARAMPGADENSAQEVGTVIAAADQIKDTFQCTVALVHHEGKDEGRGARGTSALRGAWDAAYRISSPGKDTVRLEVIDQKDAEAGQVFRFEMRQVMVSLGQTSLVPWLVASQDTTGPVERPRPGGQTGVALETLEELIANPDSAVLPPLDNIPIGIHGVTLEQFRKAFYSKFPNSDPDAKRQAFKRSLAFLQQKHWIGVADPWLWILDKKYENVEESLP